MPQHRTGFECNVVVDFKYVAHIQENGSKKCIAHNAPTANTGISGGEQSRRHPYAHEGIVGSKVCSCPHVGFEFIDPRKEISRANLREAPLHSERQHPVVAEVEVVGQTAVHPHVGHRKIVVERLKAHRHFVGGG